MKKTNLLICGALLFAFVSVAAAQKQTTAKSIVFAVLDDGKTLEPIGVIDKGELVETAANGGSDAKVLKDFARVYYKPKAVYNLIFGAAADGEVVVKNSQIETECAKNQASVAVQSSRAKLKGFVMGLATNQKIAKADAGARRLPTPTERAEIETLVRAEFSKQGVAPAAVKALKYYNLTALDVDGDGKAEMVGSFWTQTAGKERNELFFIADKNAAGKYEFGYSEYEKIEPKDVMSGDLKDLDALGGELLLDALEYDGDRTAEIFTISRAFEGDNFHVYSRRGGKWTRVFEGYNYHCAY